MKNFVPLPYRQVAVRNRVDFPLTAAGLRENLLGRDAYRRTEFIVLRGKGECAVARITKARPDDLFSPVIAVELFVPPHECHWADDAAVDVGNPSQLAAKARALGVGCGETLIVHGKYEHVNFIVRPDPIVIRVVDVIPPEPAKLWTMVNQVLVIAEDLPPIELRYEPIDLIALARGSPAAEYLFPCQASGIDVGAPIHFLDTRPPLAAWTMIGCERCMQMHRNFYAREPGVQVDFCPRTRLTSQAKAVFQDIGGEFVGAGTSSGALTGVAPALGWATASFGPAGEAGQSPDPKGLRIAPTNDNSPAVSFHASNPEGNGSSSTQPDLILTKCCLFEMDVELDGDMAIVPWGGNLRHVERALRYLVSRVSGEDDTTDKSAGQAEAARGSSPFGPAGEAGPSPDPKVSGEVASGDPKGRSDFRTPSGRGGAAAAAATAPELMDSC